MGLSVPIHSQVLGNPASSYLIRQVRIQNPGLLRGKQAQRGWSWAQVPQTVQAVVLQAPVQGNRCGMVSLDCVALGK